MSNRICPSCGVQDAILSNPHLTAKGELTAVCFACNPPSPCKTSCPACGRCPTIFHLFGNTCLVCEPYTEQQLAIHEFSLDGDTYRILGLNKWSLDNFLYMYKDHIHNGMISRSHDTGMCGKDAIATETKSVKKWMLWHCAVLISHTPAESITKTPRGKKVCRSCGQVLPAAKRVCHCGQSQ